MSAVESELVTLSRRELLATKPSKKAGPRVVLTIDEFVDDMNDTFKEVIHAYKALSTISKGQWLEYKATDPRSLKRNEETRGTLTHNIHKEEREKIVKAYSTRLKDLKKYLLAAKINWKRYQGEPGNRATTVSADGKSHLVPKHPGSSTKYFIYGKLLTFYRDLIARGLFGADGAQLRSFQVGAGQTIASLAAHINAVRTRGEKPIDAPALASLATKLAQAAAEVGDSAEVVLVSGQLHQMIIGIYAKRTKKTSYALVMEEVTSKKANATPAFTLKVKTTFDMTADGLTTPSLIKAHFGPEIDALKLKTTKKDGTPKIPFQETDAEYIDFVRVAKASSGALTGIGKIMSAYLLDTLNSNGETFAKRSEANIKHDLELLSKYKAGPEVAKEQKIFKVITQTGNKSVDKSGTWGVNNIALGEIQLYAAKLSAGDGERYKALIQTIYNKILADFGTFVEVVVRKAYGELNLQQHVNSLYTWIQNSIAPLLTANLTALAAEHHRVNAEKAAKRKNKLRQAQ